MDTPHFREGKSPSVLDAIAKQTPSKRMGEPDDIAPIVAFLASDAAGWMNGQNLRANGVRGLIVPHVNNAELICLGICRLNHLSLLIIEKTRLRLRIYSLSTHPVYAPYCL